MRINVSVERVTLEGVPLAPQQVPALRRVLEAELGRLLAEGSSAPPGGAVPVLRAQMPAPASGDGAVWGAAIAGAASSAVLP